MSNYLYFQHNNSSLADRYDAEHQTGEGYEINGIEDWRRLVSRLLDLSGQGDNEPNKDREVIRRQTILELMELTGNSGIRNLEKESGEPYATSTEELITTLLLLRLRIVYRPLPANGCPRLFVSHRRIDMPYALRMAELALEQKFAFWLDVLDPDLASLNGRPIPEKLIPLMTACIIEMALINCTHVLACITTNSRGTLWIPYEYGRIRELPGFTVNTCAWVHPDLPVGDFPEYMLLGEITQTERQISAWLGTEMKYTGKGYCAPFPEELAEWGEVENLPEEGTAEEEQKRKEFKQWIEAGLPLKNPINAPKRAIFKKRKSD